ncbi:hypothetical protein FDI02_gp036 [Citrobacter phage Mordin]|uniref:Uncharacterized protein n=1 Tax=Citrobacter phage Mordin TaxID=1701846 RepID=A0A0K2CMU6_9CAUD|nr:hypothetical protein FDI02_gp036 [Citrobacter phage Mordin]ALA06920.1 hypothetical protein Mordin_104 [Citrobacter phage Mordin]
MSLNLKEGQKVVVVDYVTKKLVTRGVVTDIGESTNYPIGVNFEEDFVGGEGVWSRTFISGERLTFNSDYLYRGKKHVDHKLWDLEVLSEEDYNRVYLERASSTYKYLMDSFLKEAVKVSEDVDKAIALLIPHIKSGKLSVETVKALIEEKL